MDDDHFLGRSSRLYTSFDVDFDSAWSHLRPLLLALPHWGDEATEGVTQG